MTRKFTEDHEWLTVEGDVATVGITNYAQSQLGDLVFVELPAIGRAVKKGAAAAVVESVKAASEVYSPLTGEIVSVNQDVAAKPELVNSDPDNSWLFKIKMADVSELAGLLDELAYQKLVG